MRYTGTCCPLGSSFSSPNSRTEYPLRPWTPRRRPEGSGACGVDFHIGLGEDVPTFRVSSFSTKIPEHGLKLAVQIPEQASKSL